MTNSGNIFADETTDGLIYKAGFKQSHCQISIYYKYEPYGSKLVVLSYVDDCVYLYTSEELGKWFIDRLGKIFHMNILGYAHWFLSFSI